jgi:hypothetical protein
METSRWLRLRHQFLVEHSADMARVHEAADWAVRSIPVMLRHLPKVAEVAMVVELSFPASLARRLAYRVEVVLAHSLCLPTEVKTQDSVDQAADQVLDGEMVRVAAFRVKGQAREKKAQDAARIPMRELGFPLTPDQAVLARA